MSRSPSLADELRSRGLRVTAQRQLVLDAVRRLRHATPDQVFEEIAKTVTGVNITTVYRTLELLEELGLITHAHLSHGAPTFHPVDEDQHAHLVCRGCGRVSEVPASRITPLVEALSHEESFTVDIGHLALSGLCGTCRRAR